MVVRGLELLRNSRDDICNEDVSKFFEEACDSVFLESVIVIIQGSWQSLELCKKQRAQFGLAGW